MEWKELMHIRQSCRDFASEQITDSQLKVILQSACAAPVGRKKYDQIQLTVIQNPELLDAITQTARRASGDPEADPLYGAPCLIVVSVSEEEGQLTPVSIANAACVVDHMHLAAADLGLGSCYLWGVIQTLSQSFDLLYQLQLKEGFWPVSALAVGKSKTTLEPRNVPMTRIYTNFIEAKT